MAKLAKVKVNLKLPGFGGIEGTWEPDESEKKAAWEMYVELVTRITIAPLKEDEGLLREALTSIYSLFATTRNILREHGPSIAQPKGDGTLSFAFIAVAILNIVLRPILSYWHPLLLHHESIRKKTELSPFEHEKLWEKHDDLRKALSDVREYLIPYANLLAEVAGVPSLIIERIEPETFGKL